MPDFEKMHRELDELFGSNVTDNERRESVEKLLKQIAENTTPKPEPLRKSEMNTKQAAEYVSAFGGRMRLSADQKQPCFMELED